ncbi:MAG: NAD-dependent malic enzyme, partial [Eubacteriales bacterium]|nr:NAD-dependent malic enzyme [Eubacteriales bacterium]
MDTQKESLRLHKEWGGKIEVNTRVPVRNSQDLSLAYTPGVAAPCLAIQENPDLSYELTRRHNLVAVITDGSAVLGLGDIGPEAGMPVMEGKCCLFKAFGDVDAFPLCIRSKDVDEIIRTVALLAGSFGGINLEDIAAPRCFEIEQRLTEICDIPIFHDDQHGTAIVAGAALINALKVVGKEIGDLKIVISGAGAAGIAIARHLLHMGAGPRMYLTNRKGIIRAGQEGLSPAQAEICELTNLERAGGNLKDAMAGADVFLGVSGPGLVSG